MRYVELHPGITSSVLGFGCAPIIGSVDAPTARRALALALEEGITHFDVARCYGFGQAERLLGECVRHRRSEVVIASKFGIVATPAARVLHLLKPLVRWINRQHARPAAPSPKSWLPKEGLSHLAPGTVLLKKVKPQPVAMQRSVEQSLRALKTDYLDYLFLHEPRERITEFEGLFAAANRLKQAGKIRAFGLACFEDQTGAHADYLSRFDLLQMDHPPRTPECAGLLARARTFPAIFFSPFRPLAARPETAAPGHSRILQQLCADFPRSVILVSMFREAHIRENSRAV
jgi:aryl-alcohol dehydrogenase-like predicted oxidoreductase